MVEFNIINMSLLFPEPEKSGNNDVGMVHVHGNRVVIVSKKDGGNNIASCDGLLTSDPEISLKIFVADCIPLAFFDPVSKSIGLVHAGWRGLNKKIIKNAIERMVKKFSVDPKNLLAEVGPHICQKHYEIKDDVARFFLDYPNAIKKIENRIYFDLGGVAKEQLMECGVAAENIKVDNHCTYEDLTLSSYRRRDMKKRVNYVLKIPNPS